MRIYELFQKLIERFVPVDKTSNNELSLEAANSYMQIKHDYERIIQENQKNIEWNNENPDAENKKPVVSLTMKHKIIQFLEQWYIRYLLAASYIFLVPKLKEIMAGKAMSEDGDEDEEDGANEFEEFKAFQRFRKQML
ncbi:MAG: hypothetical protein ACTHMM_13415 [Agriterribacter sp.]